MKGEEPTGNLPIRVIVQGALGKMGQEIVNALCQEPETQLVGAIELQPGNDMLTLPDGSGNVPLSADLEHIIANCQPDVPLGSRHGIGQPQALRPWT